MSEVIKQLDENQKTQITLVVQEVLRRAGFEGEVRIIEGGFSKGAFPVVAIESTADLSMLIGKSGQNLNALEHLIRLIVSRRISQPTPTEKSNFILDVNDYRKSRSGYVLDIARSVAQKVISTQRAEALVPMNSYERKLIHTELAAYKEIQTESIGDEPRRRIVIKPFAI